MSIGLEHGIQIRLSSLISEDRNKNNKQVRILNWPVPFKFIL